MANFITLQSTYKNVECALFNNTLCIGTFTIDKTKASKQLLLSIGALLNQHCISFSELSFIAVNHGPGPFTTLRVVIATVNGLSFASNIPLIGIDGIIAFLNEQNQNDNNVALLNAFSGDVYFGIKTNKGQVETGYQKAETLIAHLKKQFGDNPINFVGNGSILHRDLIESTFGPIKNVITETPHIESIGKAGLALWQQQKNGASQIHPHYLKKAMCSTR